MKYLFSFLFIAMSFIANAQSGEGELRQVGSFESISNAGSAEVIVKYGDQKVYVDGPFNLLSDYETKVENGTLKLGFKKNFTTKNFSKITVTIYTKELKNLTSSGSGSIKVPGNIAFKNEVSFRVSGSGNVLVDNGKFDELNLGVSGSGHIKVSGTAREVDASISGSGSIAAIGLSADNVSAKCSGSGKMKITANKELDASISGSGNITYAGNASVKRVSVSGSGKVVRE